MAKKKWQDMSHDELLVFLHQLHERGLPQPKGAHERFVQLDQKDSQAKAQKSRELDRGLKKLGGEVKELQRRLNPEVFPSMANIVTAAGPLYIAMQRLEKVAQAEAVRKNGKDVSTEAILAPIRISS